MEEIHMKKILMLLFVVSCLILATTMVASASQTVTGSGYIGTNAVGSSLSVNTSTNVTIIYDGVPQYYGATSKHKAGDKVYATGGGQGNLSGIYYQQSDAYVGVVNSINVTSGFTDASSWTAQ